MSKPMFDMRLNLVRPRIGMMVILKRGITKITEPWYLVLGVGRYYVNTDVGFMTVAVTKGIAQEAE